MTNIRFTSPRSDLGKVPAVTFGFWVIKVLATTLGETGGDWVSMSLNLGYLMGSSIFAAIFVALVWSQVSALYFRPALYWATIVATTTLGIAMAEFADGSLGIGYPGSVAIVAALLAASLLFWRWSEGTVSVESITTPNAEWFYWATILFSQTLGTALGDWLAGSVPGRLWYRLRIRRVGLRRRSGGHNCAVRLDQGFTHDPVLGGFHTHATAWRHAGGPPRQAPCQWRPELQPMGGLARLARLYHGLDRVHLAACGLERRCGMTLLNCLSMQLQIRPHPQDESHAAANCRKRLAIPVLILVLMTIWAWPGSQIFAADLTESDRSVSGTAVPSSGMTPGPSVSPQKQVSPPSSANAAPLSGAVQSDRRCAILQKRYALSEACFAQYRMKNRGLRPGAFQRCKALKDPSSECGPAVLP